MAPTTIKAVDREERAPDGSAGPARRTPAAPGRPRLPREVDRSVVTVACEINDPNAGFAFAHCTGSSKSPPGSADHSSHAN